MPSSTQNPKYDNIITLTESAFTIHNQYVFLWSVLPKISGKFTRKTQFVNEMKKYGFELINEKLAFNKQNIIKIESQDSKSLTFKAKCDDFMDSLKKTHDLKQKRMAERQTLDLKLKSLSQKIQSIRVSSGQNVVKELELCDEISSLNVINRNILIQNQEISCLISSNFELRNISLRYETTYEMLGSLENENVIPLTKYQMKSLKNLRDLRKCQKV